MNQRSSPTIALIAWAGAALFAVSLGYFLYAYLVVYGRPVPAGPVLVPAAIDTALFSLFALHHSVFARAGAKTWITRIVPAVLERSIYAWVASLLFIAVCWAWQPVPGDLYELPGVWQWLGIAVQVAGVVLTFLGSRALDVLDLAGVRAVLPRRAATPLITSGVYGIVRHPLYFGWALLVFGAPHMTATRAVFAVVSTAYLVIAIPWEERGLVATFGSAYEQYRGRVRWRMLPGIY